MKRIKTIVFVFVPIYIEIARTRVPKPAVVVSSQDRHLRRQTRSNQRLACSGLGSLITLARDPRLCYENYFQSISHGLRGRLNQKQGEK